MPLSRKGRGGALFCLLAACAIAAGSSQAQPKSGVAKIGVLTLGVSPSSPFVEAFRQGLRAHGYTEGQTVAF